MATEVSGSVSTFGQQVLSTRASNPKTRFGTGGRTEKLAEPEWEARHLGGTSTGFGETMPSGLGQQTLSKNSSAPSHKFGSRYARDSNAATAVPGPGSYATFDGSVGRQTLSPNETAPNFKIGSGGRFAQYKTEIRSEFITPPAGSWRPASGWLGDSPQHTFHGLSQRADIADGLAGQRPSSAFVPGAGTYEQPSAFGEQHMSSRASMPTVRIGSSPREKQKNQYISAGHEREMLNTHSPGPTMYSPKFTSTSKSPAVRSHGFGSGDRFCEIKSPKADKVDKKPTLPGEKTPGPGTYVV